MSYSVPTVIFLFLIGPQILLGQQSLPKDAASKRAIDDIAEMIEEVYLFPDIAKDMAGMLRENWANGTYVFGDGNELAEVLTRDLQAMSKDKHIRVEFDSQWIASQKKGLSAADSLQRLKEDERERREENYGFEQIEILEGNIGYLKITRLHPAELGGETAAAAMSFLKNTEAIIIDLRACRGGSTTMNDLLASYFFDSAPVHLYDFEMSHGKSEEGGWTYPHVPGTRMPETPLYILISSESYSAPEAFAYTMQALKRATLVGERTVGAAHVTFPYIATDDFVVWIPSGRPINPITGTNFEGVGVHPDLRVPAKKSLLTAQLTVFRNLTKKNENGFHAWYLPVLEAKQTPRELRDSDVKEVVGAYGSHKISFTEGALYYQLGDHAEVPLIKVAENEYMIEGGGYNFKLSFEEKDEATVLRRTYRNGRSYDVVMNAIE